MRMLFVLKRWSFIVTILFSFSLASSKPLFGLYKKSSSLSYSQEKLKTKLFNGFNNHARIVEEALFNSTSLPIFSNNSLSFPPNTLRYVMIPMRDGVKLSTVISNPFPYNKKKGIMLSRSPYGFTSDQVAKFFTLSNGFAAVLQDLRGTHKSEGNFSLWQKDADDGYDTMKWLTENLPWSNGDVYSVGISADGCAALTQLIDRPRWLKGQLIVWASASGHETIFPGGKYRQGLIAGWMSIMAAMTRGHSLLSTLPTVKRHEALSSFYDKIEAIGNIGYVDFPTVHLSAWWDIFHSEHITFYKMLTTGSEIQYRNNHTLFVSPLGHCTVDGDFFDDIINLKLLKDELLGWRAAALYASEEFKSDFSGKAHQRFKRVNLFIQGPIHHLFFQKPFDYPTSRWLSTKENSQNVGDFWITSDKWPETIEQKLFLSINNTLSLEKNFNNKIKSQSFTYNPQYPSLTQGGNNLILTNLGFKCGPRDQSNREQRQDHILFTSKVLLNHTAICGNVNANIFVSSSTNNTDFVVTITDYYKGKSILVRYGALDMKWRQSKSYALLVDPSKVYNVTIDLGYSCYVFAKGHEIRVSITSSNWPYYSINKNFVSNKGLAFVNRDTNSTTAKTQFSPEYSNLDEQQRSLGVSTNNTVHFSKEHPSHISLPAVGMDWLLRHQVSMHL